MISALEFFQAKKRMCKNIKCEECNLERYKKELKLICYCHVLIEKYPEKAIEIVENWAKENPVKTYKDAFLEKFPKARFTRAETTPLVCASNIFGFTCNMGNCDKCWNQEYKEDNE